MPINGSFQDLDQPEPTAHRPVFYRCSSLCIVTALCPLPSALSCYCPVGSWASARRPCWTLAWRSYDADPPPNLRLSQSCKSLRDAMERKRKLPARTSARVENANKRRNLTPRQGRSITPAPPPEPEPEPEPVVVKEPTPPPPLPTSIQPGKPLPTVESAQPSDLSAKEYQSVLERYVDDDLSSCHCACLL